MPTVMDSFNKYHMLSLGMFVESIALKIYGRSRVYKTWSYLLFTEGEHKWSEMQTFFIFVWGFYLFTSSILKMAMKEIVYFTPFTFLFDVSLKMMPVLQLWLLVKLVNVFRNDEGENTPFWAFTLLGHLGTSFAMYAKYTDLYYAFKYVSTDGDAEVATEETTEDLTDESAWDEWSL